MVDPDNGSIRGCFPAAFERRPGETFLSATWVEHFTGSREEQLCSAAASTALAVKPKDGFALCNVGDLKATCRQANVRIRVIHEPDKDNAAHVAIRQLPDDNKALLAAIAQFACVEFFSGGQLGR